MDTFISRKRRRSSSVDDGNHEAVQSADAPTASQDDTDFKLALLASLHPGLSQDALLDALLANDGKVEVASNALSGNVESQSPQKKTRTNGAIGYQSSLSAFNITSTNRDGTPRRDAQSLTRKGRTLHLFSPEDVEVNCPCTLIHNFLPNHLAAALLNELLEESPTFQKETFKLFDNVVQSPHTIAFYVDNYEEMQRQKTEYVYNGSVVQDVRMSLPYMRKISDIVQEAVNREVKRRVKDFYPDGKELKYMSKDAWEPNAAFVNCYDGGTESVGWHSDQLTYLGPRGIIGSLSLGVAREFRIRKVVARDEDEASLTAGAQDKSSSSTKTTSDRRADQEGQIAIHLPHNSLLIMHAEMQEEWKHSIAPAQTVTPHPLAGNKRINITYRHYRSYLHPNFTPKCKCGVPCVLRCVQRKKMTRGRYCWMCHANYSPGKEGCGWFEWAVFDGDGRPPWAEGFKGEGVESADQGAHITNDRQIQAA